MKLLYFAIVFWGIVAFSAKAQKRYSVYGRVIDSTTNVYISKASVSVINEKDSILQVFKWTNADGGFSFDSIAPGKYYLVVTYPEYADYIDPFQINITKKDYDLGKICMILKAHLLQEIIVKGQITAIKIKGDTTEYNAKAYKIQANDKVEDLLRQLPGITVSKNGIITAQGKIVQNVFLDGEEFFGDDPTLVTKNIRADMVDKVQVYDKKSDQAAFTGISDGVKVKTINIKLREDKKNGDFGKVGAEDGTGRFYQYEAFINYFKTSEKLSAYAITGNTGTTGLNWQDNNNYGGGGGDALDSYNGQYDGRGLPNAINSGLHYDTKWENRQSLNANYKIGWIQDDGTSITLTQNNLPDSIINSNTFQKFHKQIFREKFDVVYQLKIDTVTDLKIITGFSNSKNSVNEQFLTSSFIYDTLLNRNARNITNEVNKKSFNISSFYTKKLRKPKETISWLMSGSYGNDNEHGYLKSDIDLFGDTGKIVQKVNQLKTSSSQNTSLNSSLTFTEPISKEITLISNYDFSLNRSRSEQLSVDSSGIHQYTLLDSAYSNNYFLTDYSNQIGILFNYAFSKTNITFGTKLDFLTLNQKDEFANSNLRRSFMLWHPQVSYRIQMQENEALNINYNGNTSQPSIFQIQPLRNNIDPLNITIGNPFLKPYFNHSFDANYNLFQIVSQQHISVSGNYSLSVDPIITTNSTDSTGKTTWQYVNLKNKRPYNFNFRMYYGRKLKQSVISLGVDGAANGSVNYNITDGKLNTMHMYNYTFHFYISGFKVNKFQFSAAAGPNYFINQSALQNSINGNGKGFNSSSYIMLYLPSNLQVSADAAYQFIGKTASFDQDLNKLIINASLIKTFGKDKNLKIMLSGNDILNQNAGFSRTAFGNMIIQNTYTTIQRYFMLGVVWEFNKMKGQQHY